MAVKNMKPDKKLIVQTMKVGLPTGVQYSLMYVSTIVLQSVVNGFGESTIGAFTSVSQMELFVQQIYAGLGTSMVTYTGQNIGAGKIERVKLGMRSAMKICAILSVVLLAVFWIGGDLIMTIFVPDQDVLGFCFRQVFCQKLRYLLLRSNIQHDLQFRHRLELRLYHKILTYPNTPYCGIGTDNRA